MQKAAFFLFHGRRGRPAFHDLERKEAKESEAGKLEIQSQILRDLGDRANAVELRGELSFCHSEPKFLHPLITISSVGRNAVGFRFRCLQQFVKLNAAQGGQDPVIDVSFAGNIPAIFR